MIVGVVELLLGEGGETDANAGAPGTITAWV
jgi:hypothetical protein